MTVNEMRLGFVPKKRTVDVVFIARMLQDDYYVEG